VVAAATFWTWLWGPIGLILATPLTICLVVLGRHVDRLKFLDVLLGDQPALTPTETLYQRLLAGDPIEATEQAEKFLKENPLITYYDDVLLGALRLAEADAGRGSLDQERLQRIRDTVAEIVDDLGDHKDAPAEAAEESESPLAPISKMENAPAPSEPHVPDRWRTENAVMCVPGVGLLDEAAAIPLAQLLKRRDFGACAEEADALSMARLFALNTNDAMLICLCYLEHATPAQIRYAARRVRRKAPHAAILVSLFCENGDTQDTMRAADGVPVVKGSYAATVERIIEMAESEAEQPAVKMPLSQSA